MANERPDPLSPRRRQHWGVEEPEGSDFAATQAVVRDPSLDDPSAERRRLLWRDSATILIGVVIALLVSQTVFPQGVGTPTASSTELPSGVDIGTFGPPVSLPPGVTLPPIIDPSLGIDATPTPIPVITMGPTPSPTPSPSPSPSPTVKPSGSIKPSPKPSKTPGTTPKPSPTPTRTPEPTATPEPTVSISCAATAALTVECTANPDHIQAGSQNWTTSGSATVVAGGDGSNSVTYLYGEEGTYTITIVVTGLDGSTIASAEDSVTVTLT